ncbi:MAG: electron transfer flavoprotein subunit beta/FixA family protein [Caldisericaceae bacterium]
MKIVVLVKVVPEKIFFDPASLRIKRAGDSIFNPLDMHALKEAVKIKRLFNGSTITVVSMAPAKDELLLSRLFYFEVDRVLQLSDATFAGSDAYATAFVISKAIQMLAGDFDIILAGNFSTDGLTGQLSGEVSSMLNIPFVTGVWNFSFVEKSVLVKRQNSEHELETFNVKMPLLLACDGSINDGISPNIGSILESQGRRVEVYNALELGLKDVFNGADDSKTVVNGVDQIELCSGNKIVKEDWMEALSELVNHSGGLI